MWNLCWFHEGSTRSYGQPAGLVSRPVPGVLTGQNMTSDHENAFLKNAPKMSDIYPKP